MHVNIEAPPYNPHRWGTPWIAKIAELQEDGTSEISMGEYRGSQEGGALGIPADAGDIIITGQLDYFRGVPSLEYYVINSLGVLVRLNAQQAGQLFMLRRNIALQNRG